MRTAFPTPESYSKRGIDRWWKLYGLGLSPEMAHLAVTVEEEVRHDKPPIDGLAPPCPKCGAPLLRVKSSFVCQCSPPVPVPVSASPQESPASQKKCYHHDRLLTRGPAPGRFARARKLARVEK
jgi:hypothetical protein